MRHVLSWIESRERLAQEELMPEKKYVIDLTEAERQ